MLISERGAPSEIVINQCVLQQVVTHVESVYGLTTDGHVRGGALILEQLQDQLDDLRAVVEAQRTPLERQATRIDAFGRR
jgi:hypothetical protein